MENIINYNSDNSDKSVNKSKSRGRKPKKNEMH